MRMPVYIHVYSLPDDVVVKMDKISHYATLCVAAYMCGNLCISPSLDAIVGFELAASSSNGSAGPSLNISRIEV